MLRISTRDTKDVEDTVSILYTGLGKIVKKIIPYATRPLYVFTPVEEDKLTLIFRKPVRIAYYADPPPSRFVSVLVSRASVKISGMEFHIMRNFMNEVTYMWNSSRKIYLPNNTPPDWGLCFFASPHILEYLKNGKIEVRAKHSRTIEFFEEFVETLTTILGSEKFKSIDPRQLLNTKEPINVVRIYYYPKYGKVNEVSIYYAKSKDREKLSVRVLFTPLGHGEVSYDSKTGTALYSLFVPKWRVRSVIASLNAERIIAEVRQALKTLIRSYAAVRIAYKYMNI